MESAIQHASYQPFAVLNRLGLLSINAAGFAVSVAFSSSVHDFSLLRLGWQ